MIDRIHPASVLVRMSIATERSSCIAHKQNQSRLRDGIGGCLEPRSAGDACAAKRKAWAFAKHLAADLSKRYSIVLVIRKKKK